MNGLGKDLCLLPGPFFFVRTQPGEPMLGAIAIAGLKISAGSVSQSFTTASAQLTCFSQAGNTSAGPMQYGSNLAGDPSVAPDAANNRILLNAPGRYWVGLFMSVTVGASGGAGTYTVQLRKNIAGTMTIQPEFSSEFTIAASSKGNFSFAGLLPVLTTDIPSNAPALFPAPSGTFTGGGGFPKSQTWVDLAVVASASIAMTVDYINFYAQRLE